ncbi:MAG: pyruvate kinase [Bacillota bacterium]
MRHTKIVCTIGPASESPETLKKMILAGMNVARLNFSHGSYEEHRRRIEAVRTAAGELNKNVAVLLDLKGPKIRVGDLASPLHLKAGDRVTLTIEQADGTASRIPVNYPRLPREVSPGGTILLADGLIALKVLAAAETDVHCQVLNDGVLTSRKGLNLPGVRTSIEAVTEKDVADIHFGVSLDVDYVAASFVRRADDILDVRRVLEEAKSDALIIAKIETWEAISNLDEIIQVSDGIMVARGDLGLEINAEEVPLVQKQIIRNCNKVGKPVITATQMLESMVHNPRPTRAEASDVANAILDGTDAVMLSAETAVGEYPVEAVATMARIASRVEEALPYDEILDRNRVAARGTVTDAIAYGTCTTATDLGAAAIVTATQSGYTARMVARYRPRCPIVAVTPSQKVLRQMALVWGVHPLLVREISDTDTMIAASIQAALDARFIKGGDLVVITAGVPVGVSGTTNLIKVHIVGTVLARGTGIGSQAVSGTVRIVRSAAEAEAKVNPGDILVTAFTDRDYVPAIQRAGAVVTEEGGLTSHAAIVGLQFGRPVIVGVEGATSILPDGETVTIDGQRGLIYSGIARVL